MRLAKQIFTYAGGNLLNAAVPLLLLPVLTAYLSPADYGDLSLLQLYATLALPFFILNVHGLIAVDFYRLGLSGIAALNGTGLWLSAALCVVITLAIVPVQEPLAKMMSVSAGWILLIPMFCLLQVLPGIVTAVYQAQQRPKYYSYFKIGLTVINVSLSLWLVAGLSYGWEGRMGAMLIANLLFSVIGLYVLIKGKAFKPIFDPAQGQAILKFGVPLIPHAVCATLLAMSDRIILTRYAGLDETGKYTVAYQIAGVLSLLFTSINQALAPNIFCLLTAGEQGTERRLVIRSYKIMLMMFGLYLLFVAVAPLAMSILLNHRYQAPVNLLALMGLGFMFQGFYFVVTNYIFFTKKTYILSMLTAGTAALSVGLNFMLVPKLGSMGCGVAMACSWFVLFIGAWLIANRLVPMPWLKL